MNIDKANAFNRITNLILKSAFELFPEPYNLVIPKPLKQSTFPALLSTEERVKISANLITRTKCNYLVNDAIAKNENNFFEFSQLCCEWLLREGYLAVVKSPPKETESELFLGEVTLTDKSREMFNALDSTKSQINLFKSV